MASQVYEQNSDSLSRRLMDVVALLAMTPEYLRESGGGRETEAHQIVVEFDEAYTAFVDGFEELPSESQLLALQAIDTKVSAMVAAKDSAMWTPRARLEDRDWNDLRVLAVLAIEKFARPLGFTSQIAQ